MRPLVRILAALTPLLFFASASQAAVQKGIGTVIGTAGANCSDAHNLRASWYYNWNSNNPCPGVSQYVPMIWSDVNTGDIPKLKMQGYAELLGFNEPDNKGQSNMSPQRALQAWPKLMASGLRLGSPACTEGGTFSWLRTFMDGAKANNFTVDFLALHWYGDCTKPASVGSFLAKAYAEYQKPMWLTEFSCITGNASLNEKFFQAVLPTLKAAKGLERYAWFADRWPTDRSIYKGVTLFDPSGHLTPLGKLYRDASPNGFGPKQDRAEDMPTLV